MCRAAWCGLLGSNGEYWYCRAIAAGFGIQVRLFGFQTGSSIGAVAVRAGPATVTITAVDSKSGANTQPFIRVNGTLYTLPAPGDTAVLDDALVGSDGAVVVRVLSGSDSGDARVKAVIGFEFASGPSFGMKRAPLALHNHRCAMGSHLPHMPCNIAQVYT